MSIANSSSSNILYSQTLALDYMQWGNNLKSKHNPTLLIAPCTRDSSNFMLKHSRNIAWKNWWIEEGIWGDNLERRRRANWSCKLRERKDNTKWIFLALKHLYTLSVKVPNCPSILITLNLILIIEHACNHRHCILKCSSSWMNFLTALPLTHPIDKTYIADEWDITRKPLKPLRIIVHSCLILILNSLRK